MKYVCIDIETTGLDPVNHQILQFAAVIRDTDKMSEPLSESPTMVCYVEHENYHGQPYALAMNSKILSEFLDLLFKKLFIIFSFIYFYYIYSY